MTYKGKKDITLALYVAVDPSTCNYTLVDASGQNSGTSIQSNTPALFTPLLYTEQLTKRSTAELGSSINALQSDFTAALGSTKQTVSDYRKQTYTAYNAIKSTEPSLSSPTSNDYLAIKKELNSALPQTAVSGFTDYVPSRPVQSEAIGMRGFGFDAIRTRESIKDTQFELPLNQEEPERIRSRPPPSYRFMRFTPTETRGNSFVNVNKFTFFYKGKPLLLKGTVTNPMGTWEGTMADVTGPANTSGWSDAHKKPLVFAFREPIAIDAYTFTTGAEPEGAPISWKLEGSSNGTFWQPIDAQFRFATPMRSFTDLTVFQLFVL
jgi:hypothetical protein